MITADHGNAEQMSDLSTGQAHTAHTNLPVLLIYVGDKTVKAMSSEETFRHRSNHAITDVLGNPARDDW